MLQPYQEFAATILVCIEAPTILWSVRACGVLRSGLGRSCSGTWILKGKTKLFNEPRTVTQRSLCSNWKQRLQSKNISTKTLDECLWKS